MKKIKYSHINFTEWNYELDYMVRTEEGKDNLTHETCSSSITVQVYVCGGPD